jgi:cytoskeletal protein RodZ
MTEIGERLKQRRKELGYDYDYISQKTKIHPKILKALEDEDWGYFSSPVYLKSFLKKYAQFLNLEVEGLLQKLDVSELAQKKTTRIPPSVTPSLLGFSEKMYLGIKFLVLFIIVVGSIYLLFSGINKISSKLVPHKKYQPQIVKTVKEPSQKSEHPVSIPVASSSQQAAKSPQVSQKSETPLTLTLFATEDCWVQLRADGEKIYEGILKKGQRESWRAGKEFELWVGAASRLKVYLNGKDLGPLGSGVIRGIKIDSRGLRLP